MSSDTECDSEFRWDTDDTVVIRTRMAVAVYLNTKGDLVIRQEGQYHPSDDVWVVMALDDAVLAAYRILDMVEAQPRARQAKSDKTAADRQRRRRDRMRDSVTVTPPVTALHRDGHTYFSRDSDLDLMAQAADHGQE